MFKDMDHDQRNEASLTPRCEFNDYRKRQGLRPGEMYTVVILQNKLGWYLDEVSRVAPSGGVHDPLKDETVGVCCDGRS